MDLDSRKFWCSRQGGICARFKLYWMHGVGVNMCLLHEHEFMGLCICACSCRDHYKMPTTILLWCPHCWFRKTLSGNQKPVIWLSSLASQLLGSICVRCLNGRVTDKHSHCPISLSITMINIITKSCLEKKLGLNIQIIAHSLEKTGLELKVET